MRSSEVAYKAAQIMSEKGHCKNSLNDHRGRVCYQGAVLAAITGIPEWTYLRDGQSVELQYISRVSSEVLKEKLGHFWDPIGYNNHERTSAEDVILLLKETGRKLEELGE